MIAVLKNGVTQKQIDSFCDWIKAQGVGVHVYNGEFQTVVGLIGDTTKIDAEMLSGLDIVDSVKRISDPFKSANRKFHPDNSVIDISGKTTVGGNIFAVIAGPCSVESEAQVLEVAKAVKLSGATMLRGGAFKPRTSPYDFQGLRADGIELLLEAKRETGLPIVTEIMNANHLPLFENVDVIQVGARNMQNIELFKGTRKDKKAGFLKARSCKHTERASHERGIIHHGRRQRNVIQERQRGEPSRLTQEKHPRPLQKQLHELTHLPVIEAPHPSHANR